MGKKVLLIVPFVFRCGWEADCATKTRYHVRYISVYCGVPPSKYFLTLLSGNLHIEHLKRLKHAKELMEFLSCQVRRIAIEAKVTMTRRDDTDAITWDALDALVRETDQWSKEYVEWKKGVSAAE